MRYDKLVTIIKETVRDINLARFLTEKVSKSIKDNKDHVERYFGAIPDKKTKKTKLSKEQIAAEKEKKEKETIARIGELGAPFDKRKKTKSSIDDPQYIGRGMPLTKKLKDKLSPAALNRIFKNSRFIDKKASKKSGKEVRIVPSEEPVEQLPITTTTKKGKVKTELVSHKRFYIPNSRGGFTLSDPKPVTEVGLSETRDTGKHNDEHSIVRIWNYFSKLQNKDENGISHKQNILDIIKREEAAGRDPHDKVADYLLAKVEKAIGTGGDDHGDLNHPLNIAAARLEGINPETRKKESGEFTHGSHGFKFSKNRNGQIIQKNDPEYSDEVRKRSRESHDKNMRDAALSFARLLMNKGEGHDRELFDAGYEMVGTGKEKGELNDNALFYGMEPETQSATKKVDVRIYRKPQEQEEQKGKEKSKAYATATNKEFENFKNNPEEYKTVRDEEDGEGLSVKKGGGSQLESPDSMGFNVLYGWSIDEHCNKALKEHPDKADEIKAIQEQAHNIRRILGGFHGDDKIEMKKTQAVQQALGLFLSSKTKKGTTKIIQQGLLDSKAAETPNIQRGEGQIAVPVPKGYTNKNLGNELLTELHDLFDNRKDLFEFKPKNEKEPLEDYRDFTSRVWGTAGSGAHKFVHKDVANNILVHGIFNRNKKHTRAETKSMIENAEALRDSEGNMARPTVDLNKRGNGAMSSRFRSGAKIQGAPSTSMLSSLLPRLKKLNVKTTSVPKSSSKITPTSTTQSTKRDPLEKLNTVTKIVPPGTSTGHNEHLSKIVAADAEVGAEHRAQDLGVQSPTTTQPKRKAAGKPTASPNLTESFFIRLRQYRLEDKK